MTDNRFRRRRPGVSSMGGAGDHHYSSEAAFVRMREYTRAMVRDDSTAKFLVERAVDNIIGPGFGYEPQTGDEALDKELWHRHDEWAKDPRQCDVAGEMTFAEIEWLTSFSEYVDGDVFVAGVVENGSLQVFEADRCATPRRSVRNIVHGIQLDEHRRHVNYFFKKETPGLNRRYELVGDFHEIAAYDDEGDKQVWHVARPHRFTMARGITAFHPIFDKAGMLEDIDFALLVKQQFAASLAWFRKLDKDAPDANQADMIVGSRQSVTRLDGGTDTIEDVQPGMFIRGRKGEDLEIKSANIPSAETMEHLRWTLQMLSLNLGLPLFVATMDPSEGSFSAWRGALDQAKLGFVRNQDRYEGRLHRNVNTFNVRRWMAEDPAIARAAAKAGVKIFAHKWNKPKWKYIQPVHDATADVMRSENYLADSYTIAAEQGRDADDVRDNQIKFNKSCIMAAITAAKEIKAATGVEVHWRDVYNRAVPKGSQVLDTIEEENTVGGEEEGRQTRQLGARPGATTYDETPSLGRVQHSTHRLTVGASMHLEKLLVGEKPIADPSSFSKSLPLTAALARIRPKSNVLPIVNRLGSTQHVGQGQRLCEKTVADDCTWQCWFHWHTRF